MTNTDTLPVLTIGPRPDFKGTSCCGASTKGGQYGIICRKCYRDLSMDEQFRVSDEEDALMSWQLGACRALRRMDADYGTMKNSPLHHDARCPFHNH